MGSIFTEGKMYRDSDDVAVPSYEEIRASEWMHLHLELASEFAGSLTFMSAQSRGAAAAVNCHKAKIAEVYFWTRALSLYELKLVYKGFNSLGPDGAIEAYYALEEGEGVEAFDRSGKYSQPLVLSTGVQWTEDAPAFSGWRAVRPEKRFVNRRITPPCLCMLDRTTVSVAFKSMLT